MADFLWIILAISLLLVRRSVSELNCDLMAWNVETLVCSGSGETGNHISNYRRKGVTQTTLTESFAKYEWPRIKTFVLKDSKLLSLSPDLFVNASSLINLDLSQNPDLCFEGPEFKHLHNLQSLRLSGTGRCPGSSLLSSVPNLYALDLSNLRENSNYFSLPNLNAFGGLRIVDLSRNPDSIDFTKFKVGGSIGHLNASYTPVKLGDKCFDDAKKLKTLILSHSGIMNMPKNTFKESAVEYLNLAHNSINAVSLACLTNEMKFVNLSHNNVADIFRPEVFGTNIETLDLSYNNITNLHVETFSLASNLTTLILSHNQLSWLYEKLLSEQRNLRTLDLSYNSIQSFLVFFFTNLENLETLNLSGNQLNTLDNSLFKSNTQLKSIFLNNNRIHTLNILTFIELKELKSLDLRNNILKRLPDDILSIGNLKHLAASCNRLTYLPRNIFKGRYGLRISLHGNPWNCGCLFPILDTLREVQLDREYLTEGNYPTCFISNENHSSCDDNSLSEDNYIQWEAAVRETGIKCLI